MMKIYTTTLINTIQNVINDGKFEMITFKEYDFLTSIQTAEITLKFTIEKDGRRDVALITHNCDIHKEYISDWRTSAPGKFLTKDFKKDNRDFIGNTLYHEVKFTLNNNKMRMLVRLLNEITGEVSDTDKNDLIKQYGDITIDGKYFSIIKIMDNNERTPWSSADVYKSRDIVIDDSTLSNIYVTETSEEDINEIPDDSGSDPLF